jgi:hypothetical protein
MSRVSVLLSCDLQAVVHVVASCISAISSHFMPSLVIHNRREFRFAVLCLEDS